MTRNYPIEDWFNHAANSDGVTHLIVVQDPSGFPYPRLVRHYEDARQVASIYGFPEHRHAQKVLEVFKTSMPLQPQLNQETSLQF